jgi:hypothetical protein
MTNLKAEWVQWPCAFVATIEFPLTTLSSIITLFDSRKIHMDTLQLHTLHSGEAILTIHCQVEKDRIKHTQALLQKLPGIVDLQLLENRGRHVITT